MGRYISGDISCKLWFAVQDSDDANFFGVEGYRPNYLNYHFEKDDLMNINKGVKKCRKELGKYKKRIDDFFKRATTYNDEELARVINIDKSKIHNLLTWYARLSLGLKIQKCVKDTDSCEFEAEC